MAEMITLSNDFDAYLATPEGEVKGGLIVIHEVWGLVDHTKDVADRFAKEGYLVLAPSLLAEFGLTEEKADEFQKLLFDPAADQEQKSKAQPAFREMLAPLRAPEFAAKTAARVQACFDYLAERSNDKVAITGFCFGGTYSFSLAVREPRLKAAIPFYGHADFSAAELAEIEAPVLAFYGEKDQALVSNLPELTTKMQEAGVDFEAVVYPGTGHAFFNDANEWVYNEAAAKDSWTKTLDFLAAKL